MGTEWTVTAAVERVVLDDSRRGEVVFTVTNPGSDADLAVFDVVTDQGLDASWFSVAEPQQLVREGATVSYVVAVAVPAGVEPGEYAVQGLVYSADAAPEESSALSPRLVLEVPADEPAPSRRWPWWGFAIAGTSVLVVAVLAVVVGLVVWGGDAEPVAQQRQPTPTPAPAVSPAASPDPAAGVMPELVGLTEQSALRLLSQHGIEVQRPLYRHDPEHAGTVLRQPVAAGETVEPDSDLQLEVAVDLAPPVFTGPVGEVPMSVGHPRLEVAWEPGSSPTHRWVARWYSENCKLIDRVVSESSQSAEAGHSCDFWFVSGFPTSMTSSVTITQPDPRVLLSDHGSSYQTGWYKLVVAPLDDFGRYGPSSEVYIRLVPG